MPQQAPFLEHQEKTGGVAGGIVAIEVVLVVEVAEVRAGDPLVGPDERADPAIEPDDGLLDRLALGLGRGPAFGEDVGHGLTIGRSEEHTSELQSQSNLVCRLLLEKK